MLVLMLICSKGGKPTYPAIFANSSFDARTEIRFVVTVATLVFAAGVYIPDVIRFMDSVCGDPILRSLNEPSGGTARLHKKSQKPELWRQTKQEAPW
jgi:hypothetical protein